MSWQGIIGHDEQVERFRTALRRGRLASSFLFIGPAGVGKRSFALRLAQALLCEQTPETDLEPCGFCPACQQVEARTHPDLDVVGKPADRSFIPVETFIGDREHRMQAGVCHNLSLKPFRGGRKIAIVDDADCLNEEGANCLLKTLEEPPPRSVIILIGTSEQKQLPTIRSRCQTVRFRPLATDTVADLLVRHELIADPDQASRLAALSGGSLQRALELADGELAEFRQTLLMELCSRDFDVVDLTKTVVAFVEAAGKETPPRRSRLNTLLSISAEFYRQLIRAISGVDVTGDDVLRRAVGAAVHDWPGTAETAADCLDRCLEAEAHVLSSANIASLIHWWLDALATQGQRAGG